MSVSASCLRLFTQRNPWTRSFLRLWQLLAFYARSCASFTKWATSSPFISPPANQRGGFFHVTHASLTSDRSGPQRRTRVLFSRGDRRRRAKFRRCKLKQSRVSCVTSPAVRTAGCGAPTPGGFQVLGHCELISALRRRPRRLYRFPFSSSNICPIVTAGRVSGVGRHNILCKYF